MQIHVYTNVFMLHIHAIRYMCVYVIDHNMLSLHAHTQLNPAGLGAVMIYVLVPPSSVVGLWLYCSGCRYTVFFICIIAGLEYKYCFSPLHSIQASSSSLDHLQAQSVTQDDRGERRGSVESRHQKLERKNSGNDRQSHYEKAKRSSLERYDYGYI